MKQLYLFLLYLNIVVIIYAQNNKSVIKYRRSSLSNILVVSPNQKGAFLDTLLEAWNKYPFPDKYNKHDIPIKIIYSKDLDTTIEKEISLKKDSLFEDSLHRVIAKMLVANWFNRDSAMKQSYLEKQKSINIKSEINKQINELLSKIERLNTKHTNKISKKHTNKLNSNKNHNNQFEKYVNDSINFWKAKINKLKDQINKQPTQFKQFNTELIQDRGYYNATMEDFLISTKQVLGDQLLKDAGEELIHNTFVTFTTLSINSNNKASELIKDIIVGDTTQKEIPIKLELNLESIFTILTKIVKNGAKKMHENAKDGVTIISSTSLYRLIWNDSINHVFNNVYWNNPKAFDTTNIFNLEFLGSQYNSSWELNLALKRKTRQEIITSAIIRNVDNTFAKLQKKYDEFKPLVPVITAYPISAYIGMKEGLLGGEKFEVLQQEIDPNTYKTIWKIITKVKVKKNAVWDNRYNIAEISADSTKINLKYTTFEGNPDKILPGMLLKQIK